MAAPKVAPPKGKKAKAPPVVLSLIEQQDQKFAGIKSGDSKLIDLFKYASDFPTMDFEVFSSGFPALDRALVPRKPGVPRGRHIEVATSEPNIGKSTITMQIVAAAQQVGLQCVLAEPEATHTEAYLNQLGVVTRFDPERPHIYPLRIMRPEWDLTSEESIMHSAETFLDAVGHVIDLVDVMVFDSAAALVSTADFLKDADENDRVGGVSKLLHSFFRKHTLPRATCFWINQLLDKVGGFSPGGGTPKATTGGKAIPFYTSIRLFGARVGTIAATVDGEDPLGFWVEWTIKKNKCGPQDRVVKLPYLHGEGYSTFFALFDYAVAKKVIGQSGAWYSYPPCLPKTDPDVDAYGFLRTQGKVAFYEQMRTRPDTCAAIMAVIRGEDPEDLRPPVVETVVPEPVVTEAA